MESLNTIRPIYSLFTLATWVQSLAKVLPTIPHVGTAIPTWFRGLRLGGGRCGACSVLGGALREETPARRELHAQLFRHLHVVPWVDIVKHAAACQLHLEGGGGERGVNGVPDLKFSTPTVQIWSRKGNGHRPPETILVLSLYLYMLKDSSSWKIFFFFAGGGGDTYLFSNCLAHFVLIYRRLQTTKTFCELWGSLPGAQLFYPCIIKYLHVWCQANDWLNATVFLLRSLGFVQKQPQIADEYFP